MNDLPSAPIPTPRPRLGLAIASLVLGIVACLFSLFVIGTLFGLVGFILGWFHIASKRGSNAMAWWGVTLSVIGIVVGIGIGVVYFRMGKDFYQTIIASRNAAQSAGETDWEGVLAPDVSVTTLDGKTINLSDLKGKRVILDFWATWCGPCVKEIPHFVKLYNETSRDQLEIIGISSEPKTTLEQFVKKHQVNYPIVSASGLPVPYKEPPSIPTTFFIDSKGVIQSIVVGYHEFAQLKSLALASDYEGEPKVEPESAASDLIDSDNMLSYVEVWTNQVPAASALCAGDWDGDGAPDLLVADGANKLHVFGIDGVHKSTVSLPERFNTIECGKGKDKTVRLLGYSNWGRKVIVMNSTGKEIWNFSAAFGANGAHWGDLDGDGADEMIIGMNGFGGLQAVSPDGKKLWRASGGNVWGQAVVPTGTNGHAVVFATEASGSVRVFDGKGALLRTLRPDNEYCTQLGATLSDNSGTIQALALGQQRVVAFDVQGRVAWSAPVSQSSQSWPNVTLSAGDADGDGTNEWAFVDSQGNLVLASVSGEKKAAIPGFSGTVSCFFVPYKQSRSALVTLIRSGTIKAFHFEKR